MPMDLIDQLVADWARERPELDLGAMQIVGRIMRLGRGFHDEANALLGQHGLTYSEFDLLATLRRMGRPYAQTPSQLQASVVLTSGALTACMNRLERKGLIARSGAAGDRRKRLASLTPAGLALVDQLAEARFGLAERQVQQVDQAARDDLRRLLKALGG